MHVGERNNRDEMSDKEHEIKINLFLSFEAKMAPFASFDTSF